LEQLKMPIVELDTSEYRKMDGGLTCLSLRLEEPLP
jgi:dimethylargininase